MSTGSVKEIPLAADALAADRLQYEGHPTSDVVEVPDGGLWAWLTVLGG